MPNKRAFFLTNRSFCYCISSDSICQLMRESYSCAYQNFGPLTFCTVLQRNWALLIKVKCLNLVTFEVWYINRFRFIFSGALKFDVNELKIKSTQFTMHTSINHGEKIDKNNDVLMTNGDLNIALPTNILNTSSILKWVLIFKLKVSCIYWIGLNWEHFELFRLNSRQIHTSRSNAIRNATNTNGFSGFTCPEPDM